VATACLHASALALSVAALCVVLAWLRRTFACASTVSGRSEPCTLCINLGTCLQRQANVHASLRLQEMDELVREWRCGPLIAHHELADVRVRTPECDGPPGARARVDGADGVLCFTSYNFWGEAGNADTQVSPLCVCHDCFTSYNFWGDAVDEATKALMLAWPALLRKVRPPGRLNHADENHLCSRTRAAAARLLVT
jgi:hypothetical protein